MSKNILLISASTFKELSATHTNTDERLILPEIKAAQDIHVMPVIGEPLYNKLLATVEDGTYHENVNHKYKSLVDNYIKDALVNFVLSELPDSSSFQFTNKGVKAITGDGTETLDYSLLNSIKNKYLNRGNFYAQRLVDYLARNSITYPEFYAACGGQAITYTSPIAGMGVIIKKDPALYKPPILSEGFPYIFPFNLD